MEKRLKTEIAKRETLEATVAKMAETTEIKKIADEDLKDLAKIAKVDEIAKAIFTLRKSNKDEANVLVAQLKAMAAVNKKNAKILSEIGKANANVENGDGAQGKLDTMSIEKSQKEGISKAQAMAKILDTPEGKALYEQAEIEKRSAPVDDGE
jgi:hypothetical protein